MTLTLIGMPGAGKSTVGVVLAKTLGYDFIDTDLVIQRQMKARLPELIDRNGIEGFIDLENRILSGVEADDAVIATGGSAVYGDEAMRHFAALGPVIYLKLSCEELSPRLGNLARRGVVMRNGNTLQELFDERAPLYEKYATHTVEVGRQNLTQVVEAITRAVGL